MENNSHRELSRREFLKLAAAGAGAALIPGKDLLFPRTADAKPVNRDVPRLNPGFRIKQLNDNEIELFTRTKDGNIIKHRFKGLEADLLKEIEKQENINRIISNISSLRNLSRDICDKKIRALVKEFEDSRLVYYGNKMLVKVSGIANVK